MMLWCYNSPRLLVELSIFQALHTENLYKSVLGRGCIFHAESCWSEVTLHAPPPAEVLLSRAAQRTSTHGSVRAAVREHLPETRSTRPDGNPEDHFDMELKLCNKVNKSSLSRRVSQSSAELTTLLYKTCVLKHVLQLFHNW